MSAFTQAIRPRNAELRARWAQFLRAVRPTSSLRLIRVTEVSRELLPLVEGSLADVQITPIVQELPSMTGTSRFRVLVDAEHADIAREVVSGF